MILATDIGYSTTKYGFKWNGVDVFNKFPSGLATISVVNNSIGESNSVKYNGQNYIVGKDALDLPTVIPTRTEDFLVMHTPLFLTHIISANGLTGVDTVCVSLSLTEYKRKKDRLSNVCTSFKVEDKVYNFKTLVFAQGLGIWADCGSPKECVIVDIGYNTIDVLTVRNGIPQADFSFGLLNMGTCNVVSGISSYINQSYNGLNFSEMELNEILYTGKFKNFGAVENLSSVIADLKVGYSKRTIDSVIMDTRIANVAKKTDNFIFAGGGAYFIDKDTVSKYGIMIPNEPEYSNVRGYLKLA